MDLSLHLWVQKIDFRGVFAFAYAKIFVVGAKPINKLKVGK